MTSQTTKQTSTSLSTSPAGCIFCETLLHFPIGSFSDLSNEAISGDAFTFGAGLWGQGWEEIWKKTLKK